MPAGAGAAAADQPSRAALRRAEAARARHHAEAVAAHARAAAIAATEAGLTRERVAAAAQLRAAEDATAAAADRMASLAEQRKAVQAALNARARALGPMLPLIERLALFPSETLLAVPAPPQETLRGLLVLHGLSREIGRQAAALKKEQDRLAALSAAMQAQAPALAEAEAAQAKQEAALDAEIAQAAAIRHSAESAAVAADKAAARDAAQASDLAQALARIAAARRVALLQAERAAAAARRAAETQKAARAQSTVASLAAPAGGGLGAPAGAILAPVAGRVVRGWGAPTLAGPAEGLSYATPPGARVIAPCAGTVLFGSPFHSYGLLMIIDCGKGYDFVLAGLDRLDVSVGQTVQSGEPVGVMAGWNPRQPAQRPELYMELRQNGEPVNPAPWLRGQG
ncbi:murein hydrolase activator EnvC family protein [Acidisoma sp. C75]